jgi:hypothetical protein
VPVAAEKPHVMVTVLEPAVAPEGNLLWGEFKAIIAMLESRIRMAQFTDNHTKPVRSSLPPNPNQPSKLPPHRS